MAGVGKLEKLLVEKEVRRDGVTISWRAWLLVSDESEDFREIKKFGINLDGSIEEIMKVKKEAEEWVSVSRRRLERAKEVAKLLNVPLEFEVVDP